MRKIRILFCLLLIACVIAGCFGFAVSADSENVNVYIERFRKDTKCSSVSVSVYSGGSVSYYGDQKGLYQIGSMTKAFTGLAIQKLISEGKLDPNSRVSDAIPGFTASYKSVPYEITVNHLLTQTSGYTNSESLYPSAGRAVTLQEWANGMSGRELQSAPGEKYSYSNVNFNLLGAVIERVSGKAYKDYMEKEILAPLGLYNTFVSADPHDERIVHGSRLGYRHAFRYEIPVAEGRIPAGYFYSNVEDMALWIKIWLGKADIPEEYKKMVSEVKTHLLEKGDYYSGWEVFEKSEKGHSGGTPNYSSRMVFSEEKQTGVVVLTNLNAAASTDSLCNGIFQLLSDGSEGAIAKDVWTVFDIIFSVVSAAGVILLVYAVCKGKRISLLVSMTVTAVLVISICVIMPVIFGAGLGEIMFTWAPLSFTGALILLTADILIIGIKLLLLRKNADREKTS